MASEDMMMMMMDETSLSYLSSSTSNESSSSLASTSDDYLLSSTDSVKPTVTKTILTKIKLKFWRCAKRSCHVLLHKILQDDFLRYSGRITRHSHLPDSADIQMRNLREAMRNSRKRNITITTNR